MSTLITLTRKKKKMPAQLPTCAGCGSGWSPRRSSFSQGGAASHRCQCYYQYMLLTWRYVLFWNPWTEFALIQHITSLLSKSRAFWHVFGSRLYRHPLRQKELAISMAAYSNPGTAQSSSYPSVEPVTFELVDFWKFTVKGPRKHPGKLEWKEETRVLFHLFCFCFWGDCRCRGLNKGATRSNLFYIKCSWAAMWKMN